MTLERPILISVVQFAEELSSGRFTIFDLIKTAQHLGVDGVELRREAWPNWQAELEEARQQIEQRGLLVTYATFATLFNAEESGQATLRQDIDAAAALGSPQLRVFLGPAPADEDETGWAAGYAAVKYAAQRGIVLALENFARTPGGKLAEIQRVLERIPHPALATNIDIANYVLHGEDVPAAIRILGARAVSTHLKDQPADLSQPATWLGGGNQALDAIFSELDRLPQRIIHCFEFGGAGDPEGVIRRSLDYLRQRR